MSTSYNITTVGLGSIHRSTNSLAFTTGAACSSDKLDGIKILDTVFDGPKVGGFHGGGVGREYSFVVLLGMVMMQNTVGEDSASCGQFVSSRSKHVRKVLVCGFDEMQRIVILR